MDIDVEALGLGYGMAFYPYLWAEAEHFEKRHREPIPMEEIIGLEIDFFSKYINNSLGLSFEGSQHVY